MIRTFVPGGSVCLVGVLPHLLTAPARSVYSYLLLLLRPYIVSCTGAITMAPTQAAQPNQTAQLAQVAQGCMAPIPMVLGLAAESA